MDITDKISSVEPFPSIPVDLTDPKKYVQRREIKAYIFLGKANEAIARPYSPNKVELTPC